MSKKNVVPFETTLHVRDTCLCLHVQRAARALARRFDEALRPLGLTNGQLSLMMSLNRPEPPTMAAVAALLALDRTTLTAALKPLQRRGLVEVVTSATDKRARLMNLTSRGLALLASAVPVWKRTHIEIDRLLPDGDMERTRENLRAIAEECKFAADHRSPRSSATPTSMSGSSSKLRATKSA
jgi:DNA-binding MarR family transcriptional regulator